MSQPKIKSSQQTRWSNQRDHVEQPKGIDYNQLLESMNKESEKDKSLEKKSGKFKDLRKKSYVFDKDTSVEQDESLKNLDKNSIIPVPGLMVEYEDSNSNQRPPDSNWIAPHGPQWGPMTQ